MCETVTMYRPTGAEELELLKRSGFRRWPPRLPEQPIFYPVTTREYAAKIASSWNVRDGGVGFVTRFRVAKSFADRYETHEVGGRQCTEWWMNSTTTSSG